MIRGAVVLDFEVQYFFLQVLGCSLCDLDIRTWQHNGEFFTSVTRYKIATALQSLTQCLGYLFETVITLQVAVRIVKQLEVINIYHDQGNR